MARPKSEDKRNAIMAAAIRVIDTHGLSAPTAMIAKEAGISNGSLFTYFETKADLYNQLYLELKTGMAVAIRKGLKPDADLSDQVFHVWSNWIGWAVANPEKRGAQAKLNVSDEITPATHAAAFVMIADVAELVERSRAKGPMRKVPMEFVLTIISAMADATMDFIIHDPTNAKKHSKVGFEAVWRVLV